MVMQAIGGCGDFECGTSNSPEIDNQGVHEFDSTFRNANDAGFQLMNYSKAGISYTPVVSQATLTGRDGLGNILLHDGGQNAASLIGSQFWVKRAPNLEYIIRIDGVGSAPYFAKPDGRAMNTQTYLVNWIVAQNGQPKAGADWKNICHSPPVDPSATLGMDRFHVVLFEGDRIDAVKKVVYAVDLSWFNIGCAGAALSKQHLDGHTQGAMELSSDFDSTLEQRTAHLKMLAADYCGSGVPLTVSGQKLNYTDDAGWMQYASSAPVLEARWNADGASCLNLPRVKANSSAAARDAFPDIETAISNACAMLGKSRPQGCQGPPGDFLGHHILSANP
jgi:hypothetical protein